uniref:Uncharacterized protein n=1 Tax=Rhizophora mucronata TaxID=61149 RepID=A0A2P2P5P9_RHIMU
MLCFYFFSFYLSLSEISQKALVCLLPILCHLIVATSDVITK